MRSKWAICSLQELCMVIEFIEEVENVSFMKEQTIYLFNIVMEKIRKMYIRLQRVKNSI